jgi:hypothetical protein
MIKIFLAFIVLSFLFINPTFLSSQNFDYHREESPSISWNGVPLFDARMLGMGGISLMASPMFAASVNPALIPSDKVTYIGLSYNRMNHEAFQYWGMNQGVFYTPNNLSAQSGYLSGVNLSAQLGGIRVSAGYLLNNRLKLPNFWNDGDYTDYDYRFSGEERTVYAAAAFSPSGNLDIGVKLAYLTGKREVSAEISRYSNTVVTNQNEEHNLSCLIPSIGLVWNPSPAWKMATTVVYPVSGKARRRLINHFSSPSDTIVIDSGESDDSFFRPPRFYFSTSVTPVTSPAHQEKSVLTLAGEVVYSLWSDYEYESFSETVPRNMRNTLEIKLAIELGLFNLFNSDGDGFLRLGYRRDPQPIRLPEVTLNGFTGGIGFRFGRVLMDVGGIYYSGSTEGYKQNHWVINGTLGVRL